MSNIFLIELPYKLRKNFEFFCDQIKAKLITVKQFYYFIFTKIQIIINLNDSANVIGIGKSRLDL